MKGFEKIMSLDLKTLLFFVIYSIIGIIIVVFMTKKTLREKKNESFIAKSLVIFYSVIFGGFIILFPWIAVSYPIIAIIFFIMLSFVIIISNFIYSKKK